MSRQRALLPATATVAAIATAFGVVVAPSSSAATPDITVDPGTTYQTIDGFGAATPVFSDAASQWTTSEAQTLTGTGPGQLGLSIVRTIISPDSSEWSWAVNSLKAAKAAGSDVKILASPWTAPASFKTNNSRVGGGELKTDYYDDYAAHLNDYVQYMKQQGVTIDVTSVQNEPDWPTDYDSMEWSGDELRNFVRDQGANIHDTKLLVAESLRFDRQFTDPTLEDPAARDNIGYVGGHFYDTENSGNLTSYPLATQYGKNQWMTEWNLHEADGDGSNIWGDPANQAAWDETLDDVMLGVHKSMDVGWSAFIWWYGRRYYSFIGDGESQYGTQKGAVLKRGQAFSQYAKYVRPGDVRVGVSKGSRASGLDVTAYTGRGKTTLVILNRGSSAVDDAVVQVPQSVSGADYVVTSRTQGAATQQASVSGGQATIDVPARSISTLTLTDGAATDPTDPSTEPSDQPSEPTDPSTGPSPTGEPTTPGDAACTVTSTTTSWGDGLVDNLTITNNGTTAIDGWSLQLTLGSGQAIVSGWGATFSPSTGTVTATDAGYNAVIPPGGSTTIGFQASHSGSTAAPTAFALNGASCG